MRNNKNKRFSILICAYNEGKNINLLIDDLQKQETDSSLTLDTIVIVSDFSTDGTNEIVEKIAAKVNAIKFISNKKRLGKARCFNVGRKYIDSDFLVSLDADIRILDNKCINRMLKTFTDNEIGLVGGEPTPVKKNGYKNMSTLASLGSFYVLKSIKKRINGGNNFYSAHGRILALSKKFYQIIEIPNIPGTDQYLYLLCVKNKYKFIYQKGAVIFYNLPNTVKDYVDQNNRARRAHSIMRNIFGNKLVTKETTVPFYIKLKAIIETLIIHPMYFFVWLFFYLTGEINFIFKPNDLITGIWRQVGSTK